MCCFGRKRSHNQPYNHLPPKPILSPNPSEIDTLSQSFHSLSIHPSPTATTIPTSKTLSTKTKSIPLRPQTPTTTTTTTTTPTPPIPTFPLRTPTPCLTCSTPGTPSTVLASNLNNNVHRPYYKCRNCKSTPALLARNPQKGWITWDDDIGVHSANRRCFCGWVCRQDRMRNGKGFWTCAVGGCEYRSFREDGRTEGEVRREGLVGWDEGFEAWLL